MNLPPGVTLAGAVLAGGRSSRMGRDKAFLRVGSRSLVERQLAVVSELCPAELLLSGRPGLEYGVSGVRVVLDSIPDGGPLSGIEAVLAAAGTTHVLIVAVDLPGLRAELPRMLCARVEPGVGAVACSERGLEPLVAVYPVEAGSSASARLRAGRLVLCDWVEELLERGRLRRLAVPAALLPQLRNVNEPSDFAGFETVAEGQSKPGGK